MHQNLYHLYVVLFTVFPGNSRSPPEWLVAAENRGPADTVGGGTPIFTTVFKPHVRTSSSVRHSIFTLNMLLHSAA